jgi:FkbM family methyltransferase
MAIVLNLKRHLVGTAAGALIEDARGRWERAIAPASTAGTVANDHLALRLVTRLAEGQPVFLDLGAHIGSVFATVLRTSPGTQAVAIEAMPDKAAWLRRRFPMAVVHQCAAGDATGSVAFYVNERESGYSSLTPDPASNRIEVPMRRIDDLLESADVVKADIEGAELGAFRGAQRLIERARPIVMFESGPTAGPRMGYALEAMHDFWTERGYGLYLPNRVAHLADALSLDCFIAAHEFPRRTTNYFALPEEKRAAVRERARHIVGVG